MCNIKCTVERRFMSSSDHLRSSPGNLCIHSDVCLCMYGYMIQLLCWFGSIFGQSIAPAGIAAWNPSFDVTPSSLITGVITELGVVEFDPSLGTLADRFIAAFSFYLFYYSGVCGTVWVVNLWYFSCVLSCNVMYTCTIYKDISQWRNSCLEKLMRQGRNWYLGCKTASNPRRRRQTLVE